MALERYYMNCKSCQSSLQGWTVIVLKRHCEEMHKLTNKEFQELAETQNLLVKAIKSIFNSKREYIFCFAEAEGFKHIHFHVVPKHENFDDEYSGAKVFHYLKPLPGEETPKEIIIEVCNKLKNEMTHYLRHIT